MKQLYANNKLKNTNVSDDKIVEKIILPSNDIPELILIRSTCRGGSTALARVFARAGYLHFHQPIKSIFRNLLLDQYFIFEIPRSSTPIIIKETYGAHSKREWTLNYLGYLLKAGYPPEKIKVVDILRDPILTYTSCKKFWNTGIEDFVEGYQFANKLSAEADSLKIRTVKYSPALLKIETNEKIIRKLFKLLNLKFSRAAIDWTIPVKTTHILSPQYDQYFERNGLLRNQANTYIGKEPDFFRSKAGHDKLNRSNSYLYEKSLHLEKGFYPELEEEESTSFGSSKLYDIYKDFLQKSMKIFE